MVNLIGISGRKQSGKDTLAMIINYLANERSKEYTDEQVMDVLARGNKLLFETGQEYQTKQFAGKLKQMVALALGCNVMELENNDFKKTVLGEEWSFWYIMYQEEGVREDYTEYKFSTAEEAREYIKFAKANRMFYKRGDYSPVQRYLAPRDLLQLLGTEGWRGIHPNAHINMLFADYKPQAVYEKIYSSVPEPEYPKWIITDVRFPNEVKAIEDRGGIVIRISSNRVDYTDNHPSETSLDKVKFEYNINNNGTLRHLFLNAKELVEQLKDENKK
jgi:hypothetical protein